MRTLSLLVVALAAPFAAAQAHADTFNVPGDAATIQGAIDLADGDDEIVIKKGTYNEEVRIENLNGITLRAKGKVVIDTAGEDDAIVIINSDNVNISRLTIQNVECGISVSDSDDVTISKCKFSNMDGSGLNADHCERLLVEKCKFDFTDGDDGIRLFDVNNSTIEKCKFARIGEAVLNMNMSSDNMILRNKAKGAEDGFAVDDCHRNLFEGNQVIATEGDAFDSGGVSTENVWRNNKALRCSGDGIRESASGNTWERNTMTRMGDNGLNANGDNNTFRSNKLLRSLDNGVVCRGTGNTFETNTVDRSRVDGFEMREGGNTLTGNKIKRSVAFDINEDSRDMPSPNIYMGNKFKTATSPDLQP